MTDPTELQPVPAPPGPLEMRQAVRPSPELGRFLYTAAGGNWFWTMRLGWTYDQWLERLSHPRVETWVLYEEGTHVCNNMPFRYRPLVSDWMWERLA